MKYWFISLCALTCHLFAETSFDVAIIGSGPAGLTASIYAVRSGLSTIVIEGKEVGGQITLSSKVENFPGFPQGIEGLSLTEKMREQAKEAGVDFCSEEVKEVYLLGYPFLMKTSSDRSIQAKSVIIATGATPRWLGIPSETALRGKGVNTCAVCDGFLYKGKEVVVVGGGDASLEDALYLSNLAAKVTVIHRRKELRASKVLQETAFAKKNIFFIYDAVVEEILDVKKGFVEGVVIKNQMTQEKRQIPCQGIFIAIGHIPSSYLFKGQIDLNEEGYIVLEPFSTKTSVQGVFAAGDVADPKYRQAVVAAGFGAMAAIDAFQFLQKVKTQKESE